MTRIPETFHDLFEKQTFAHVATLMSDDTPQVTPVWIDYDADRDRLLVQHRPRAVGKRGTSSGTRRSA